MVGAGPGGLALACALTKMENFEVRILETRSANQSCAATSRSHSIGLGRRAREALVAIGGQELWEAVTAKGMVAGGFTLHLNGFPLSVPTPEGEPVVLVDRGDLTRAMRDFMVNLPCAAGTSVTVQHSARVQSVDLVNRRVLVETSEEEGGAKSDVRELPTGECEDKGVDSIPYDLLLGSDGVRSRVRAAMNDQLPPGQFESELKLMPGRWQVLHMDLPPSFNRGAVHALVSSKAPFGMFCIPSTSGSYCNIVSWSEDDPPTALLSAATPEELQEVLLGCFPKLEAIPRDAAERFLEDLPSKAVVSRCRPLHDVTSSVCVLGDAAHAVGGGSLGQGCSAALQDAAALATCLQEAAEQEADLGEALNEYSNRRAAEGWALLDLIQLQSAAEVRAGALLQGPVVMGFFLEQLGRGTLRPLAELGARFLNAQLRRNRNQSLGEVRDLFRPLQFSPVALGHLHERLVFRTWKFAFSKLSKLGPPLNTALMATSEPYSRVVERNLPWLTLLRSAEEASGVSRISAVHDIRALADLPDEQSAAWARGFGVRERLAQDTILRQNSEAKAFYAIRAGSCTVLRNGVEVATLGPGDSFGEVGLMLGLPSPITVVCSTDTTLLEMPAASFIDLVKGADAEVRTALTAEAEKYGAGLEAVAQSQKEGKRRVKSMLLEIGLGAADATQFAAALGDEESKEVDMLDCVLGTAKCEVYFQGEVVTLERQSGRVRLLEDGECSVIRGGQEVRRIEAGSFFGPDLVPGEQVVACSEEVNVCCFEQEASEVVLAELERVSVA